MPEDTKTPPSPIATLGASLNYSSKILDELLNKKPLLATFETLKKHVENLNELHIPKTAATRTEIETALIAFTDKSEETKTFLDGLDQVLKDDKFIKKLSKDLNAYLASIKNGIDKTKEAAAEDEENITEAELQAYLNLQTKPKTLLTAISEKINQQLQSEDIVLSDSETVADYFLGCMATALFNNIFTSEENQSPTFASIRQKAKDLSDVIDNKIHKYIDEIIHDTKFKIMEANWTGLNNLIETTDWSADVKIDMLDCTKEVLSEDLENNAVALNNGDLFKKVYVAEYDQFGGLPYGGIIGLFQFENTKDDRNFISTMGKLANASHAPFISSVGPIFFGCSDITELAEIKDLAAHMSHPRFERWQALRDSEEAAYIGLTLPRFLLRSPYDPEINSAGKGLSYKENITVHEDFLWGNASLLFAKNMIKSFAHSGWCQYIRGPKGGGKIEHLPRYEFNLNGQKEIKAPIEMVIPDYRELAFADAGFIPLIYRKGGSEACFFSSKSIKKPIKFKDPHDSENSQLVTNLAYTLSITRIAHYIKCIMRDNIGSSADDAYINNVLQTWLSQYV
ncbi:MAG: type VI secretion system protein ImpC, partial [Psychromonas sp.]